MVAPALDEDIPYWVWIIVGVGGLVVVAAIAGAAVVCRRRRSGGEPKAQGPGKKTAAEASDLAQEFGSGATMSFPATVAPAKGPKPVEYAAPGAHLMYASAPGPEVMFASPLEYASARADSDLHLPGLGHRRQLGYDSAMSVSEDRSSSPPAMYGGISFDDSASCDTAASSAPQSRRASVDMANNSGLPKYGSMPTIWEVDEE